MTYAAVASLSQTIDMILNHHRHSISPLFKYQITSVDLHIKFLLSFIDEFPDEASAWEERIGQVANVAEDIIELLMSDSLLQSTLGSSHSDANQPFEKKHEVDYDLRELERVAQEIESIVRGVKERAKASVGTFNDDLAEILSRLREGSFGLEIIQIFGTRGTGKTTVATNAFNNSMIMDYFNVRAWATVSKDYNRRQIMLDLLGSMNCLNAEYFKKSGEELVENVRQILLDKRYLIVLDDIWGLEAWDELKFVFSDYSNGSRILLTTRMHWLATRVGFHSHTHEMHLMNGDQSWILLRNKVFEQDRCPPELEPIGKVIAKSCRGHRLAIHVVAGILNSFKRSGSVWEDILESLKTVIECGFNELLLHIFYLSYIYLPHHLKPCFLYLGFFPEDYKISVSKLTKLWVAEGFLDENESRRLEETGEDYLEDLVRRSLVMVSKRKSNDRIKSVRIQDPMMREVCIRQAHLDNFFLLVKSFLPLDAMKLQRRVSNFHHNHNFLENGRGSTIRTAICLEGSQEGKECSLEDLILLRILDLSDSYYFNEYELTDDVFEQFHLRYLALYYPFNIPAAISKLQNLQILVIHSRKYSRQFIKLPMEIWRLPQLRHLIVHSCVLPSSEAALPLENLQTLSEAVDFVCSRETLELIPNLKKLSIFYTKWKSTEEDYQLYNLVLFQRLEILKIEMSNPLKKQHQISLAFPPTLKILNLSCVGLPWEDTAVLGLLPNLQVLKLRNHACIGSTWETTDGGFPQLNFLLIEKSGLMNWITQSSHFPRLKSLVLYDCNYLDEIPDGIGEISSLEVVDVDDRNKSLVDSAKQIRKTLHCKF